MSVKFNCVGYVDRRTDDLKQRGDALEQRQSEALQPITIKPVSRPIYRNTHIHDYGQWSQQNHQALLDYWNQLVTPDGLGPLGEEDFFLFTRIQHEAEQERMKELRESYMDRTEYTARMGTL
jgi:hypothetical protein